MKIVIIEITYADDIDFDTCEALADAMQDGEGVACVSVRMASTPAVRIVAKDDEPDPMIPIAYCHDETGKHPGHTWQHDLLGEFWCEGEPTTD